MSPARKKEILQQKAKFVRCLRKFFDSQNFTEIDTPFLLQNPGLEPNLEYFHCTFRNSMGPHQEGPHNTLFLPTSPEYSLKKALSWGLDKIYEIKKCFRNGEISKQHHPEFSMLEWYRSPGGYQDIAHDFRELCHSFQEHFDVPENWTKFRDYSISEVFHDWAKIPLKEMIEANLNGELQKFSKSLSLPEYLEGDTLEDLFHKIFLERIESRLPSDAFVFLWDYPAVLGALSQEKENHPYLCKRFEVYWKGLELGNCFDEECHPEKLESLCQKDLRKREILHPSAPAPSLDREFIEAHHSISSAGGIAVGVDRLFMALQGLSDIRDTQVFSFPPSRPQNSPENS